AECSGIACGILGRPVVDEADDRHRCLLRTRRQRPRYRRAAEQRYELAAAAHSITPSAMARKFGGTVRPSALTAFWFMASSNLIGCSTGISPGFVPRRILST